MLIITAWVRNPNRAKSLQTKPIKQARRKAGFFYWREKRLRPSSLATAARHNAKIYLILAKTAARRNKSAAPLSTFRFVVNIVG
jgi:hypothetical protein